ncbi:MAG TPA: hypothetical protein VGX48_11075 [Pyrinomonadaceae bacterium]|jgi:hypothetical protein|nr:hypothetical protein [Pyrinomonadaceae bacterium]
MFGLGKIFSGFFDSIGLGWMGSVLSLATNVMMGNWAGVAEDVFRLVSEFSNDSWQNRVDRDQPLGRFGRTSCFGENRLSSYRADELSERTRDYDPAGEQSSSRTIYIVRETTHNSDAAIHNVRLAYSSSRV